jgi:hypothetical protein
MSSSSVADTYGSIEYSYLDTHVSEEQRMTDTLVVPYACPYDANIDCVVPLGLPKGSGAL